MTATPAQMWFTAGFGWTAAAQNTDPTKGAVSVSVAYADYVAMITAQRGGQELVVSAAGVPSVQPFAVQLAAYAQAKQVALRDGGITVNVGTAAALVEVDVASDVNGRGLVSGCVQLVGLASSSGQPAPSFPWINNDGTQLTLTGAQMMTIGLALGNFVQATYASLGTVLAAIASGTISTTTAIDASAWPTTSF